MYQTATALESAHLKHKKGSVTLSRLQLVVPHKHRYITYFVFFEMENARSSPLCLCTSAQQSLWKLTEASLRSRVFHGSALNQLPLWVQRREHTHKRWVMLCLPVAQTRVSYQRPDQDPWALSMSGSPSNHQKEAAPVLGQQASAIKAAMPARLRRALWELWRQVVQDQECS